VMLVFVAIGARGCHGGAVGFEGELVGGPCGDDRDCVEDCLRGKDHPHGTCSVPCRDDHDCPEDTRCIDEDGGMCLLPCDIDDHCRADYECRDAGRRGHSGDAAVCLG